jgi:OHCU decarboxylase
MTLEALNSMAGVPARDAFRRCCGSAAWAERMVELRPFTSEYELQTAASRVWRALGPDDWREAFSHHPRIGERKPVGGAPEWSKQEQRGVDGAAAEVLVSLRKGNEDYERKFGHVFLVCATGKSAAEMLGLLNARIGNDSATELTIAAGEQEKITRIRLEKLLKP